MNCLVQKLAYVGFPKLFFELMRAYVRLDVEGIENIPRRGRALIVPNHSGCSGLDAVVLGHLLHKELERIPRILALWTYFELLPCLEDVAKKMGLKRASARTGLELLRKNRLTVLFPEGAEGSLKPSSQRYQLRHFHTGFIRMAILSGAPVIPCVIIGAEESNINLATIRLGKYFKGLSLPVPLNMIPLPAKWKIRFLSPLDLSEFNREDASNRELMLGAADRVKKMMQKVINQELSRRPYIYFPATNPLISFIR